MIPWRVLTLLFAVVAITAAPVSDLQPELRTLLSRELKFSRSDVAEHHGDRHREGERRLLRLPDLGFGGTQYRGRSW